MMNASPVMYSVPVYYEPVALEEAYSWRPGADSDQVHLYLRSRCVGGYRYSTNTYFAHSFFNGVSTYSTEASEPPIEPPYRDGGKRWAKLENRQPEREDPFRMEFRMEQNAKTAERVLNRGIAVNDRDSIKDPDRRNPDRRNPDPKPVDAESNKPFNFEDVPTAAWIFGAAGLLLFFHRAGKYFSDDE